LEEQIGLNSLERNPSKLEKLWSYSEP
jgi:hypothetical protein